MMRTIQLGERLIAICMFAAVCALVVPSAAQADSGRAPGGNIADPVVRQIDIASLAVVRVATLYEAHITLNLCGVNHTLPRVGPGYTTGVLGSGAFISAHGDILTADHVIAVDTKSLDDGLFQQDGPSHDIAGLLNNNPGCQSPTTVTANDVANGLIQNAGIAYSTTYSAPQYYVWQSTSLMGPYSAAPQQQQDIISGLLAAHYETATVSTTSSLDENDLAIIHVPLADTPSITLDDSANVAVADQLTVIGFPGNGDAANNDPTNLLTPSVNSVTVSAIKRNENSESLIQVGGNVEHGDSGGPVLDSQGHIVGVVSFAGPDPLGTTSFLRASDSARMLISDSGVNMAPGAFERQWEHAIADYASSTPGHWHQAAKDLDALLATYPHMQGIDAYRRYADQAAAAERTPRDTLGAWSSLLTVYFAGGFAVAVVILALLAILLTRRERAKRARLAFSSGYYMPYAPLPLSMERWGEPRAATWPLQHGTHDGSAYRGENTGSVVPDQTSRANGQNLAKDVVVPRDDLRAGTNHASSGTDSGVEMSPGGEVAAPPAHPQNVSFSSRRYELSDASHTPRIDVAIGAGFCTNGHPLPPGAMTCSICGAPRDASPQTP